MDTVSGINEQLLLTQVVNGDRKAFSQLYAAHIESVHSFIYLFTKSREETEEVLQEVFIAIWEKRDRLHEVQSFKSYLLRMAKNKVIDRVRRLQIQHKIFSELRRTKVLSQESTAHDLAYREYYRVVKEAIENLPPKRKLIFRLNIENGLSHDEIAEKLSISKTVVKNQLYKANDSVRQYLLKHGELCLLAFVFLAC